MSFCPYYLLGLSPDCQVCSCLTYTEYFSTKEGDKPELCISYKQQFTHSFKSTSVVLDPHPVSWPCPPWIWLLSLYYPISGLYPKIFFMCACLMRFRKSCGTRGVNYVRSYKKLPPYLMPSPSSFWKHLQVKKKEKKKKGGEKSARQLCPCSPWEPQNRDSLGGQRCKMEAQSLWDACAEAGQNVSLK